MEANFKRNGGDLNPKLRVVLLSDIHMYLSTCIHVYVNFDIWNSQKNYLIQFSVIFSFHAVVECRKIKRASRCNLTMIPRGCKAWLTCCRVILFVLIQILATHCVFGETSSAATLQSHQSSSNTLIESLESASEQMPHSSPSFSFKFEHRLYNVSVGVVN